MRIAVAYPAEGRYTETFIRAHVEGLPGEKLLLTDGYFPTKANGRALLSPLTRVLHHYREHAPRAFRRGIERTPTRRLASALKTHGAEVAFAEYGMVGASITEACRRTDVPLVVHFHGADAHKQQALREYREAYERMFAYASAIVAVSSRMCHQLESVGAPAEKIFYVPCSVDLASFTPSDPASAPPRFLAVGRFVDKKAPQLTVLAFREVLRHRPDARLVMAADGPLREACRVIARALAIDHAIEVPGVLSHAEVASLMHQSRAFVQHSVTTSDGDSEGTPVAVLEAAASGLPVVSTDHAGISEAVVHGVTGLLVEEGDVDGMARNLLALANDPSTAARMGAAAREHVAARYAHERSLPRLASIVAWAASRGTLADAPARLPEWAAVGGVSTAPRARTGPVRA
jgi:glycosyltransferase involved in cell wall biosynthesis